jgi:hypothetical protein
MTTTTICERMIKEIKVKKDQEMEQAYRSDVWLIGLILSNHSCVTLVTVLRQKK